MERIKRQRITKWLNIFLLVINISAISTIIAMNQVDAPEVITGQFNSDEFLRQELNLTDDQFKTISELDAKIFRIYQSILDMQCEEQFKLLNELLLDDPSQGRLDSLAVKIGQLHTGVKRQTIKHFLNIKSIVDEEQKVLLDQLLIDMMKMNDQCKFCNKTDCDRRTQISGDR